MIYRHIDSTDDIALDRTLLRGLKSHLLMKYSNTRRVCFISGPFHWCNQKVFLSITSVW